MLAATPGPSWSSLRARLRSSRSAFWRRQVPRLGAAPGGPTQQAADLRVEPALDQIVDQRLDDCGIFGRPLDQAKRTPIAVAIDVEGGDQHQVGANMQAIDLDNQQVDGAMRGSW